MSPRISFASATSFGLSSALALGMEARLVGGEQGVEVQVEPLVADGGANDFGVLANKCDFEHGVWLSRSKDGYHEMRLNGTEVCYGV